MSGRRTVLILSTARDGPATARVARALEERGARAVRFDTDAFPGEARATLRCGGPSDDVVFESDHGAAALSELTAIWLRRLDVAARLPAELDERFRAPARREAYAALLGMVGTFPGRTLDPFDAIEAAAAKPRQLQVARRLGLETPRTLVTNDPAAVRDFARACPAGMITKALSGLTVRDAGDELALFTSPVGEGDLGDLDGLHLCPMVFQEVVPKRLEIRAVMVGGRVFAAAVDSSQSAHGRVDWRRAGAELDDRWARLELPREVADRLVALAASFGLRYSAADLIVTPDGRHVFLESNPAGEWLWLDSTVGLGIADAIADELLLREPS